MILSMCVKPFEKEATKDDTIYKYIYLDRCDLFYAILEHLELYKNGKQVSKGVKILVSFMLSYQNNERPSATEAFEQLKQIKLENGYEEMSQQELKNQMLWRLDHHLLVSNPNMTMDLAQKIKCFNRYDESSDLVSYRNVTSKLTLEKQKARVNVFKS